MPFTLRPYVGADPVRFDMDATEVAAVLGPAGHVQTNILGERAEQRVGVGIRYSDSDGKVVDIGLWSREVLLFEGHDILHHEDPVGFLLTFDPNPAEVLGFLVFMELGVTLTGFHDNDDSQKAATVFRRGRWDSLRSEMTPFRR